MGKIITEKFDKAKVENVEWFSRFTLLGKIRIVRKNMQRARNIQAQQSVFSMG